MLGLRIVDAGGTICRFGQALGRTVLLVVDLFFLIGLFVMIGSKPHRRIGDNAAGTYVVDVASVGTPVIGVAPPLPEYTVRGATGMGCTATTAAGVGCTATTAAARVGAPQQPPPPAWGAPAAQPPVWGTPPPAQAPPPPAPTPEVAPPEPAPRRLSRHPSPTRRSRASRGGTPRSATTSRGSSYD